MAKKDKSTSKPKKEPTMDKKRKANAKATQQDGNATKAAKAYEVNRNFKDGIFTEMFLRIPEYKVKAVQQIAEKECHDFDDITPDEIKVTSLGNVFVQSIHNDVSMEARGKSMFLIEAQSTWSINILVRVLIYYSAILFQWAFGKSDINIYGSKRIEIPRPYFCYAYTGDRKSVPNTLSPRRHYAEDPKYPLT